MPNSGSVAAKLVYVKGKCPEADAVNRIFLNCVRGARDYGQQKPHIDEEKSVAVWIVVDGQLTSTFESLRHSIKLLVPPASDNLTLQANAYRPSGGRRQDYQEAPPTD